MFAHDIAEAARAVLDACRTRQLRLATAESCTGGLIGAALTAIPGSSDVVERGFITYSNEAKSQMLGVPADLIVRKGAVSMEVAMAMAEGALKHTAVELTVAVTGVAGPGGGSDAKPVGLVHIATAKRGGAHLHEACRFGPLWRDEIREASVRHALKLLLNTIQA